MWRAAASILLGALASFAADVTVDQVMTAVRSDVKPQQAMEYMRRVYATDRWFTFPKFQETAEYLKQAMRDDGLENVEVLGAPADGVTHADQLGKAPLEFGDRLAQGEVTGRHQSADLGQDRGRIGELLEQIGISNVVHGARQVE